MPTEAEQQLIRDMVHNARLKWKYFFLKGPRDGGCRRIYTCRICRLRRNPTSQTSWALSENTVLDRMVHILSHTPDEVRTFLAGDLLLEQPRDGRSEEEQRAGLLFDLLVDLNASVHAVERPAFKRLVKGFGVKFPTTPRDFSDMIDAEAIAVQKSTFPKQATPIPAGLALDDWMDSSRQHYYCVLVRTKHGTKMFRQYTTKKRQDAAWLANILSKVVSKLAKRNYHVVGMTCADTPVITAAWERVRDKIPIRQTCICHSINLCLEDALKEYDAIEKMTEVRDYLESLNISLHTDYTPARWYSTHEVFQELVGLRDVIEDNSFMRCYVSDFEAAENLTKIVCDFLAIAERSDASFILVAMALRAFDQNTRVEPLTGLNDAIYGKWKNNSDPNGIFKAVVSMAPCFFGDEATYDYWGTSSIATRRDAISRLAVLFGLEIRRDVIMDLLLHRGLFAEPYWGLKTAPSDDESSSSSDVRALASVADKEEEVNLIMNPKSLEKCLAAQESSLHWWWTISKVLDTNPDIPLDGISNDDVKRESYANLVALWDILMAIMPASLDIERVVSANNITTTPHQLERSPSLFAAVTSIKMDMRALQDR